MTRLHYAAHPLVLNPRRRYRQDIDFKPAGLWYSVGRAWATWCRTEAFGLDRLACVTMLRLDPARVLRLRSVAALDAFNAEYGATRHTLDGYIDWPRVAARWAGIEIAPYQWARRLGHYIWYYGWDCASGCVWDLAAIRVTEPVSA